MRKGIALFSTLMILVLVIILMAVALKNSTNIKKNILKDRYIIQENLTVNDVIKLFETQIAAKLKGLKGIAKVEAQQLLFSMPLQIQDSVTNSTIDITMIPNDGKVNINFVNSINGKKFIKTVFEKIGIKDVDILIDILLANIKNTDEYRDDYKIFLKDKSKRADEINNYNEFLEMLDIYVQQSDDTEAYDIDFEKYFYFYINSTQKYSSFRDSNILDINYIEVELIDSVPEVAINNSIRKNIKEKDRVLYSFEEMEVDSDMKKILETYGFGFETKNIILQINITSKNNKVKYLLNYNLKDKKITNISMDRWIY